MHLKSINFGGYGEITTTQQALVDGMSSGFSQIAKLHSSQAGERFSSHKQHAEDKESDTASEHGSLSAKMQNVQERMS